MSYEQAVSYMKDGCKVTRKGSGVVMSLTNPKGGSYFGTAIRCEYPEHPEKTPRYRFEMTVDEMLADDWEVA